MSKIKNDSVLTTDEAMQYLKISKPTLLKCLRLGKINATKVGREWRFLQSELYQFLKGTRV
jgi:excisionase family DNA binding protein